MVTKSEVAMYVTLSQLLLSLRFNGKTPIISPDLTKNCLFFWVSHEGNNFVATVYRKPTFSGAYTQFDSYLFYHRHMRYFARFGTICTI